MVCSWRTSQSSRFISRREISTGTSTITNITMATAVE